MATPTPPYTKLSNGDIITIEKLGPQKRAVLSNSEGVIIRKGNFLIGTSEKILFETIILSFPSPNPTIAEQVLSPISPPTTPTPPTTPPVRSPKEVETKRQQEKVERDKYKQKLKLAQTVISATAIASMTKLKGLDKLNQSINDKVATLQSQAIDQLFKLATDLGIEGLDTGKPNLPNSCPPKKILESAVKVRDSLVDSIEVVAKYINIVDGVLKIVNSAINGTATTLTTLTKLKSASTIAASSITPIPGAIPALLSSLDDIRTTISFKDDGTPRLPELKRSVTIGALYISQASSVFNIILGLLSVIDQLLKRCGEKVKDTPKDIIELTIALKNTDDDNNLDLNYKGFIFTIIEKPFSPTLNQKIAQAKDKQGIVLLQTQPSFTQNSQVLIEELKFIIDRDNLKADIGGERNPVL